MLNIVCVLKTGGDFDVGYVVALYNGCRKNITCSDFVFECFTDDPELLNADVEGVNVTRLAVDWKGWWSKFAIFTRYEAMIYFDLDTVIVGNIDAYVEEVEKLNSNQFIGLKAFNPMRNRNERTKMNSGMMGWNGDFGFVMNAFDYSKDSVNRLYLGDQDRISEILRENYIEIKYWQDLVPGLYSYKRHIVSNRNRLPVGAKIICFHGHPRPKDVELIWVKENWKCEKIEN